MLIQVSHDVRGYNMLHDFTTDTREGYGAIVLCLDFRTFFVNWGDYSIPPYLLLNKSLLELIYFLSNAVHSFK